MTTILGPVKDGRIEPDQPVPEGARVEIRLAEITMDDLPEDLREELDGWQLAGAQSLENFERMLEEEEKKNAGSKHRLD
jgi:hypothetical protein